MCGIGRPTPRNTLVGFASGDEYERKRRAKSDKTIDPEKDHEPEDPDQDHHMSKNTGVPYEVLTQQIFQQLLNQSDVKNVRVEQNVILKGKTAAHQIDVFWQYEVAGITYTTVVQTKDWSQTVQQGQLLMFKSVLEDLPNQPRGVFVTRTGYQSGAKDYAMAHGIQLYELRPPKDDDLKDGIATIKLTMHILTPRFSSPQFVADDQWLTTECQKRGVPIVEARAISISGLDSEIFFFGEDGGKKCDFKSALKKLLPPHYKASPETDKEYNFDQPSFLHTGSSRFPRIKVAAVRAKVSVTKEERTEVLKAENIAAFILRDVNGNKTQFIDEQNRPIKRRIFK